MLKQNTVTFKETDYLITQFSGTKGIKLFTQVSKLAAPVLSALYSQEGSYLKAVEAFLLSIEEVDFEKLAKELMQGVTKNNMQINFDTEFAGNYDTLLTLMLEVVKLNFESVFTLLGS
jgi:hypothetical protein